MPVATRASVHLLFAEPSAACTTLIPTLAEAEGESMDIAGDRIRTMDALCRNASGRYVLRHRVHDCRDLRGDIKALSS
ncbi:hypothetical protein GCM10017591_06980 [Microbacterium dextranolyticum]|uniref:Uncharacterized protein n=1 Tax=Microbacterium dextranolyticum TaxID=36806 RepID=A0A9W6M5C8_9MICO|nr:hypothetical protein GCM10017591_06980 [Microbacterium dextranolyticum]